MKKKVWLVLLAAVLVFGLVVSCGSSGSDGDRAPVKAPLKIPTEIELEENVYGDGYQAFLVVPLEKGDRVIAGDEWTINIKYKVDRNVPDGIQIGLVDRETNYWNPLSYDGDAKKGEPNAIFQTEALVAGTEYTLNKALVALKSSPKTGDRYNSVVFQTEKEYTRPSGDSGKHTSAADDPGPVTITVTAGGEEASGVEPFIKGLQGFTSIIKKRTSFADSQGTFHQWVFTAEELAEANYFVFSTDGSLPGANVGGFGGIKIGFQNIGGSWSMSDRNVTTANWTNFDRSGISLIAIDITKLPDWKISEGSENKYQGVTTGEVRIYIGYWGGDDNDSVPLALDGFAALVKGNLVKPAAGLAVSSNANGAPVIGFIAKVE